MSSKFNFFSYNIFNCGFLIKNDYLKIFCTNDKVSLLLCADFILKQSALFYFFFAFSTSGLFLLLLLSAFIINSASLKGTVIKEKLSIIFISRTFLPGVLAFLFNKSIKNLF